jgi:hypothetical protein
MDQGPSWSGLAQLSKNGFLAVKGACAVVLEESEAGAGA